MLVNGASGGVGAFAVQIAKALGAHVTGVCSVRNVELVRSIGADEVVDYTSEDFARRSERYDLILDAVGNRSCGDPRRAAAREGTIVFAGGSKILSHLFATVVGARVVPQRVVMLRVLAELVEAGKLTPVVDRTYPLAEAAEAVRYSETGRASGKVVVAV